MSYIFVYAKTKNQEINAFQYITEYKSDDKIMEVFRNLSEQGLFGKIRLLLNFFFLQIFYDTHFILGDFRLMPVYIKMLMVLSKSIILVDDGISTFWFYRDVNKNPFKRKIIFYTKYSKLLKRLFYDSNKLINQKVISPKIRKTNNLIFLGGPYVESGWVSERKYRKIIQAVCKKLKYNKILYICHPIENRKNWGRLNVMELQSDGNLLKLLKKYGGSGSTYVTCFSSGLVDAYTFDQNCKFLFTRLPDYKMRSDIHHFGFNVECSVYALFTELGFEELKL